MVNRSTRRETQHSTKRSAVAVAGIDHRYRLFILGAGFSVPAGLPLASELYRQVRAKAARCDNPRFRSRYCKDRRQFIEYVKARASSSLQRAPGKNIDIEQFLGFLDVRSFLGLDGAEQFAQEGSESQILVRWLIAQCLWESQAQIAPGKLELYEDFAKLLDPTDIVITFNYDTLLELALDRIDKPYKLVRNRFNSVDGSGGIVDGARKEVTILKMHGSIDWFDKSIYLKEQSEDMNSPNEYPPPSNNGAVFDEDSGFKIGALVEGPYPDDSSLLHMHRVRNIDALYSGPFQWDIRPSLLLPSVSKVLNSPVFADFWWGFNFMGAGRSQIILIGYSLPTQDEYAFQAIYTTIRNYLNSSLQPDLFPPRPIVAFVKESDQEVLDSFRRRLSFIPANRLRIDNAGFGEGWHERLKAAGGPSLVS